MMSELKRIFAWSIEASVRPRSPKKFLREVVRECPGEERKVKQISIGSRRIFFIYCALSFSD
jgi:hypothetical protein